MPDPIEQNLQYLTNALLSAWKEHNCMTCPLAELAALAQATLTFYQEHERREHLHWSVHWQQQHGEWT